MGIRIHSGLMFKYREDLVCQWFFPTSDVFDIVEITEFTDSTVGGNHESRTAEKGNPASQPIWLSRITAGFFSVFPNHALDFCQIPDHAEPLPDPGFRV